MEATYLGLPNQPVGIGETQLIHDSLDSGAHLLRIGVPSVDHLQQRHMGVPSPTQRGVPRASGGTVRGVSPGLELSPVFLMNGHTIGAQSPHFPTCVSSRAKGEHCIQLSLRSLRIVQVIHERLTTCNDGQRVS